jgi:hypothetical protein
MKKILSLALCTLILTGTVGCSAISRQPSPEAISMTQPYSVPDNESSRYGDIRVSPARTVNVEQLKSLKAGSLPYDKDMIFLTFAQETGNALGITPVAFAVGKAQQVKGEKSVLAMRVGVAYNGCTYPLTYIGTDDSNFQYYTEAPAAEGCYNSNLIRVEKLDDMTVRISAHDKMSGLEMWAGVANARLLPPLKEEKTVANK